MSIAHDVARALDAPELRISPLARIGASPNWHSDCPTGERRWHASDLSAWRDILDSTIPTPPSIVELEVQTLIDQILGEMEAAAAGGDPKR